MIAQAKSSAARLWLSLQYREQASLLLCATAIILFVAYMGVARPLMEYRDATARQLAIEEARFARITALLAQISPQESGNQNAVSGDVRANLLALAEELSLNIDRVQADALSVTLFFDAPPDAVFTWLSRIETELNAQPVKLSLRKANAPNLIAVQAGFPLAQ